MVYPGPRIMRVLPVALLGMLLAAPFARAQLMLQGAIGPPAAAKASGSSPRPVSALRPPREEALLGHDLLRGGTTGRMVFERTGTDLKLARLSLPGDLISRPGESCQVDVAGGAIATKPAGLHDGLLRYEVELPACPFSIDVLDGAVLATTANQTCDFVEADCRVSPAGLWGPPGSSFNAERAKAMARALVSTEATMRSDFHALLKHAGKDMSAVKALAGEQAGFSSEREVLCRDYSQEARHGFCALRVTEARLFALQARLGDKVNAGDKVKATARKDKAASRTAVKQTRAAQPQSAAPAQTPAN
jgi:hypothetical protein